MPLGSRFLVILTGWLTVAAFSIGMLSIVYAETVKIKSIKKIKDYTVPNFNLKKFEIIDLRG